MAQEIDHDSPVPPYLQVVGIIEAQIASGELASGARVPSITTLVQTYGIAKNTAIRALGHLRDRGLVEIKPGWGTFVA
jgi:GntR family transcriptional regulator